MTDSNIRQLLAKELHPRWRPVQAKLLDTLAAEFQPWFAASGKAEGEESHPGARLPQHLVEFLIHVVEAEWQRITALRLRQTEFHKRYTRAVTQEEQRQHILEYAQDLGADRRQLAGDRRAFSRWFGPDAVTDRYRRRHAAAERKMTTCLQRLGTLAAFVLREAGPSVGYIRLWNRLELGKILKRLLAYDGDSRVRLEAFRCLSTALQALPHDLQEGSVDESTLQYIFRSALDTRQQVWIQSEALSVLQSLSPSSLQIALERRLGQPQDGDDLFVCRRAVLLLGENLQRLPTLVALSPTVVHDPSPFVRQALARALRSAPGADVCAWFRQLVCHDPTEQVRAAALLEAVACLDRPDCLDLFDDLAAIVRDGLEGEKNPFVLRVALKVVTDGVTATLQPLQHGRTALSQRWCALLLPQIDVLHRQADSLAVRRWAAQAWERVWCTVEPQARTLWSRLEQEVAGLAPGKSRRLKRRVLAEYAPETVGRVLSVMSQEDFGYAVEYGVFGDRITRGHVFRFRLWRLLHEFRHPSPDKRQAFRHTIGRIFRGTLRAPSGILAELAETKVPGEPLQVGTEAGWRPYVPLVDEALSCLDQSVQAQAVHICTSEGVTALTPPASLVRRLWAKLELTWRFAYYARLRNWQEHGQAHPSAYIRALRKLGFEIHFRPYQADSDRQLCIDPAVGRFFAAGLSLFSTDLWQRMQDYFFSAYENSLSELILFMVVAVSFFVGRHLYLNYALRRTRGRLPLVIGGWGTRGKSGTERIKAAMLNALGYSIVSKTTGCEAMFLHAHPFHQVRELFLFRPYDKATIWEQFNLMRLADKLDADIFLWECMALSPPYVCLLQRHWVRDDIVTLTNTFPDHEDIQGPAGIDIPEVMTNFIPPSATLLTSEEQMRPILRVAADELGTTLSGVGWMEAGLLTPDVLARFPYAEHPSNIALVLALGDKLGVAQDFALKEMADYVVPDIGVLKVYPAAPVRSRRLEFINGMSANERFGCLGNWTRLGFDTQDPEKEPGVWISTVVNNRADRIARSRVFASILVEDISADRHFLIGSNLHGLVGYIHESWQSYVQPLTLWLDTGEEPWAVFTHLARRLRMPTSEEQVRVRLRAMLQGQNAELDIEPIVCLWAEPSKLRQQLQAAGLEAYTEHIVSHVLRDTEAYKEYEAFAARLGSVDVSQRDSLDSALRDLLRKWFQSKLVIIEDYSVTGNQIINRICEETPPGFHNRIMGLQNIKGPGLDFVYRWQAWDTCQKAASQLRTPNPLVAEQGLRALVAFQEYGLVCEEYVQETVEMVRHMPLAQTERFQAELTVILSNLATSIQKVNASMHVVRSSGWLAKIVEAAEAVLDAGDAVKRRKTADQIYTDLVAEQISQQRAGVELQALNKRQKGGWLINRVQGLRGLLEADVVDP